MAKKGNTVSRILKQIFPDLYCLRGTTPEALPSTQARQGISPRRLSLVRIPSIAPSLPAIPSLTPLPDFSSVQYQNQALDQEQQRFASTSQDSDSPSSHSAEHISSELLGEAQSSTQYSHPLRQPGYLYAQCGGRSVPLAILNGSKFYEKLESLSHPGSFGKIQ
ncbi:hypothetical protein MMC13_008317 [Lambiella insularis]|nr:hypothetical protein [Lambiella insularis]